MSQLAPDGSLVGQLCDAQARGGPALARQRPPYHVHFTPTYGSWLNHVEIWFNINAQKAIWRGSYRSVAKLIAKIRNFVRHYNAKKARPFA